MTVDELVSRLASEARPVRPRSPQKAIWPALATGALASIGAGGLVTGMLPSLFATGIGFEIVARVALSLAFCGIGLATLLPSLRPDTSSRWAGRSISATSLLLLLLLTIGLPGTASANLIDTLAVAGVDRSPLTITALACPVFFTLVAAVRGEAPTHLNVTGAALGLLSGGIGAAAFFLASPDEPVAFVPVWYAVGIGLAMLAGSFAGPRLLRW